MAIPVKVMRFVSEVYLHTFVSHMMLDRMLEVMQLVKGSGRRDEFNADVKSRVS